MSIYNNIKKLLGLFEFSQKISLILLFILMFIAMILETLSIALILPALSLISDPNIIYDYGLNKYFNIANLNSDRTSILIYLVLLLCIFFFIKTICITYVNWKQLKLSFGINVSLSKKLFKNYLENDYSFHFTRNSSTLIRNTTIEIDQLGGAVQSFLNLIAEGFIVIGITILLISYQPISTIFLGSCLGIFSLLFYKFTKKYVYNWGKERQYHQGKRIQIIQQGLGAIKHVKLLNREDNFIENYSFHNEINGKVNMLEHLMTRLPRYFLELIAVICVSVLIILLIINENNQIIPTIGLFAGAAFRLLPSLSRIVGSAQGLRYTLPSVETLSKEFKNTYQTYKSQTLEAINFKKNIEIRNVDFHYDVSKKSDLSCINLKINFGESIGFIGKSGSGKSTLMDLILGLIQPSEGSIIVDGVNIKKNISSWQSQIGYVPQNIYMTDESLAKNIALGVNESEINYNLIRSSIKLAQLDEFVRELPSGIETQMGERGIRLSGGQLQRVGIARALYNDPAIIVFDEASSALDIETEKKIMHDINKLKRKKTILIITHRLSTLEQCDHIYKLDEGILSN